MKKNVLPFLTFLFLISCEQSNEEITLLDLTIDRLWEENLRTVSSLAKEVEDGGNRQLDVEILNHSKKVLQLRKEYRIPESIKLIDTLFKESLVLKYIDSIEEIIEDENIDFDNNRISETRNLISAKSANDRRLQNRFTLISLLMLESDFFVNRARKVGSACGFYHRLNFNTSYDNLQIGEYHESITSVAEFKHEHIDFQFRNVSLTLSNKPIEFETRPFGSAIFLKFLVTEPGRYKFSFDLITKYMDMETEFKQYFETEIEAKEKSS